jgi:hypothetical protein
MSIATIDFSPGTLSQGVRLLLTVFKTYLASPLNRNFVGSKSKEVNSSIINTNLKLAE